MARDIIKELQSDPNLYAECPNGEVFRLKDAVMFYADGPTPETAQRVADELREDIARRRKALALARRDLPRRVERTTVAVGLGKILEKLVPAMEGFGFEPHDARALFEPIDYVVFDGLSRGEVKSLVFLDVKTGGARLTGVQKQVQAAVEGGRVAWDEYGGKL